jgi:hypothetical protein
MSLEGGEMRIESLQSEQAPTSRRHCRAE